MSASIPLVDLSHHLSDEAKNLRPNPLKGMYKYWGVPGLINLAGVPHPSLFPYETIKANVLVPTKFPVGHANDDRLGLMSRLWAMFNGKSAKSQISIPKYANPDDGPNAIQLSTALQYSKYRSLCLGMVDGMPAFLDFVRNFTLQVFQPAYSDFHVLANTGNTDGWTKASTILCQPGELILTEVWTYPGAVLSTWPSGVRPLPVPTDSLGMIPSELERILGGWKEDEHGGKRRPHVMYTIPIGQNPTGAIMGTRRKQEVYDICVKYDIIIVEDDPYYFLQFPDYTRKSQRSLSSHIPGTVSPESSRRFIDTLEPSYLKYDITILHKPISSLVPGLITKVELSDLTHSRRLTIGPGCRLGWTTCNPLFANVMVDYGACKTNQASGISQALVIQLVSKEWGYDGYIRWLRGKSNCIGAQYTRRRNFMVDCFFDHLALQLTENHALSQTGATVYDARTKPFGYLDHGFEEKFPSNDQALFSFSVPNSGMFLWIKVHLKHHRDWVPHPAPGSALEFKLWTDLAEAGVIVAPGYMFSTEDEDMPAPSVSKAHSRAEYAHMRVSFSSATDEDTKKGIDTFVEVVLKFFR